MLWTKVTLDLNLKKIVTVMYDNAHSEKIKEHSGHFWLKQADM